MTEEEFDAFYEASFPRVVAQITAMCGNLAEAQDCTQEAFVRAWDKRKQLDTEQSPEAWVRTVAYRLSVSRWRKTVRGWRQPDRALEDRAPAEPNADRVVLERALAQLPDEQRRVIVMYHLADMSVDEIAAELGSPSGTIKARLSRGRAALAKLLVDRAG